jgi:hypothetical protein
MLTCRPYQSYRLLDPTARGSGSVGASSTELYDGHQVRQEEIIVSTYICDVIVRV